MSINSETESETLRISCQYNYESQVISLLQAMHSEIISLKAGQDTIKLELNSTREELNSKIDYLQSQLDNRGFSEQETVPSATDIPCNSLIRAPIPNTWDITLKYIFKMMSEDLGIEIICDELAVHPLVKDLGSCSSWGSISVMVRKQMCAKHAMLMKDAGINLTRCHENWASASRISHL
ncbi:hypothetical protein PHYBLDRAFT_72102 [Phycomyces blakesleeanus NRRL 1555(-)]|uniref:Homeodomain-like DNA binding domain-containing transcription factor n=1 Tax=Phycomyces blakesleeanus (strain ATCC 8743b / DSM 1359 / FGSC 10004 / NBRC 33097 / NRRL 1555) TaxID=763407 RepID=A0A167M1N8_PHYB8|nr:hypothetical protein PHYBLDRAFT_72102 [Phycomyces blakesleeanus NRRL 1555(-)]OAD71527.1 hypothetical protein PHYBLDRAFT_72102 [Phycomyces blakesleeanus NRRL 1555(-)]|eukprot:XP_018289567.1 hypothetical protein PHYBLDRAFT_72102 [Phycomyces blakesleeanus NRRL 1555(-)]